MHQLDTTHHFELRWAQEDELIDDRRFNKFYVFEDNATVMARYVTVHTGRSVYVAPFKGYRR